MKKNTRNIVLMLIIFSLIVTFGSYSLQNAVAEQEQMEVKANELSIRYLQGENITSLLDNEYLQECFLRLVNQKLITEYNENIEEYVWATVKLYGTPLLESANAKNISLSDYLKTSIGAKHYASLLSNQANIKAFLESEGYNITYKYSYTELFNGFGIRIKRGDIASLSLIEGIESVTIAEKYLEPTVAQSSQTIGAVETWDKLGYQGQGTVIAIIDNAFDTNHSAFATEPENQKLSKDDVSAILNETEASETTVLDLDINKIYHSGKIAYAFDYADCDTNVHPSDYSLEYLSAFHGTHVAGIAAGQDTEITGIAPQAQLVLMKVFSDLYSGAYTTDILAALTDAVKLNVDVINMSLGSPCGFASSSVSDEINKVYQLVNDSGINLVVAAGNDYYAGIQNSYSDNAYADAPDNGLVGSPSTFIGALSVASIDNAHVTSNYIKAGELNIPINLVSEHNILSELNGKTLEIVVIPGIGDFSDYEGLDVTGKIAMVMRGTLTFSDKVINASKAGAAACIIYNNRDNIALNMQITDYAIPTCAIPSYTDALKLIATSNSISFSTDYIYPAQMSDFSSLGVSPELGLKPEITAPGGQIYSSVPNGEYATYSGTSMAAPNLSGQMAIVRQYLNEKFPELNNTQKQDLAMQLLMSTATKVIDTNGMPYLVRKQGAGLSNVYKAVTTSAYLTVDNCDRTKIELGDDKQKTGIYTLKFNLVNMSENAQTYQLSAIVMTDTLAGDKKTVTQKATLLKNATIKYYIDGQTTDGNITVLGNKTVSITIEIALSEEEKAYLDESFVNGMYIEGWANLDSLSDIDLAIPFLAFYGDWDSAPLFDSDIYDEEQAHYLETTPISLISSSSTLIPMGTYLYNLPDGYKEIPSTIKLNSLSAFLNCPSILYGVYCGTLRSSKTLTAQLTDYYTGEVLYTATKYDQYKTFFNNNSLIYTSADLNYRPYLNNLNNNQLINVKITGTLASGKSESFDFQFVVDYELPTVHSANINIDDDGKVFLVIEASDNHQLMDIQLMTFDAEKNSLTGLLVPYAIPIYDFIPGEFNTIKYEITDYVETLKTTGLGLYIEDYALNASAYGFEIANVIEELMAEREANISKTIEDYKGNEEIRIASSESDFIINNGIVNRYIGAGGDVVLPDSVLGLGSGSFAGIQTVTSVTFNSACKEIGASAFNGCGELISIVFPDDSAMEKVNPVIFANCAKLASINLENTKLTEVGLGMFQNCALLTKIKLPTTITILQNLAFSGSGLLEIDVNNAPITAIMNETFANCPLKTLDLTKTKITKIMQSAFKDCKIESIDLSGTPLIDIMAGAFTNCANLINVNAKNSKLVNVWQTVFAGCTSLTTVDFSYTELQFIYQNAFSGCTELTSIDLSNTKLDSIMQNAFMDCAKLENVNFENSPVTNITENSFMGCSALRILDLSKSENVAIKALAFKGCVALELIKLSNTTQSLAPECFKALPKLQEVVVGSALESIGVSCFSECTNLKKINLEDSKLIGVDIHAFSYSGIETITLPATVKGVSFYAFANCNNLISVYMDQTISTFIDIFAFDCCEKLEVITLPDTLASIGTSAFHKCISLKALNAENTVITFINPIAFQDCSSLESVLLPSTLETIGAAAFANCTALKTLNLGNTKISSVNPGVFSNCSSLIEVTIPGTFAYCMSASGMFSSCASLSKVVLSEGIVQIPETMFEGCGNLLYIQIPSSVQLIGNRAFANTGLLDVDINTGNVVPVLAGLPFEGTSEDLAIFVKANTYEKYAQHGAWNSMIDHVYDMADYNINEGILLGYLGNKTNVPLPLSIVEITSNVFNAKSIEKIRLNNGLQTIGEAAFANNAIKNVKIPESVTYIGKNAFDKNGLTKVVVASLTPCQIGENAFGNYSELIILVEVSVVPKYKEAWTEYSLNIFERNDFVIVDGVLVAYEGKGGDIVIPESVHTIGVNVFLNNIKITSVELPSTLLRIEDYAFEKCLNMKSINLQDTQLIFIGTYAFANCSSITELIMPLTLKSIENYACYNMINLIKLDLGGIETIGIGSFANMANLESVNMPHTVFLGKNAFYNATKLTSINMPVMEELDNSCLSYTSSLEYLEFPKTLRIIGQDAFLNSGLLEIIIPDNVEEIKIAAFNMCTKTKILKVYADLSILQESFARMFDLEEVHFYGKINAFNGNIVFHAPKLQVLNFYDDIGSINDNCFCGMSILTTINFYGNVEYIGGQSFSVNESLTDVIFHKNVGLIADSTFATCDNLKHYSISENNEYLTIDEYGVMYNKEMTRIYKQPTAFDFDGIYVMPDSVVEMDEFAFGNHFTGMYKTGYTNIIFNFIYLDYRVEKPLLQGIVFGKNITTIGENAFMGYTSLKTLDFSKCENLQVIKSHAFDRLKSITEFSIPNGIKELCAQAFYECESLTNIIIPENTCNFAFNQVFIGCPIKSIIVHPNNAYYCSENGILFNKDMTVLYHYSDENNASVYFVPESIVKIADYAFMDNEYLTRIVLPSTLKVIGNKAFFNTPNLLTYIFNSTKAPTLEAEFHDADLYSSPYCNFMNYLELLEIELTAYIPVDSNYQNVVAYNEYFANFVIMTNENILTVSDLALTSLEDIVTLTWKTDIWAEGYEIYRINGDTEVLAGTSTTGEFIDCVEYKTLYQYRVVAFKTVDNQKAYGLDNFITLNPLSSDKAQAVVDLINTIYVDPSNISAEEYGKSSEVVKVRDAYNNLSEKQQALVSNYNALIMAENALNAIQSQLTMSEKIDALTKSNNKSSEANAELTAQVEEYTRLLKEAQDEQTKLSKEAQDEQARLSKEAQDEQTKLKGIANAHIIPLTVIIVGMSVYLIFEKKKKIK